VPSHPADLHLLQGGPDAQQPAVTWPQPNRQLRTPNTLLLLLLLVGLVVLLQQRGFAAAAAGWGLGLQGLLMMWLPAVAVPARQCRKSNIFVPAPSQWRPKLLMRVFEVQGARAHCQFAKPCSRACIIQAGKEMQ
jgi:hypothetical protein